MLFILWDMGLHNKIYNCIKKDMDLYQEKCFEHFKQNVLTYFQPHNIQNIDTVRSEHSEHYQLLCLT